MMGWSYRQSRKRRLKIMQSSEENLEDLYDINDG